MLRPQLSQSVIAGLLLFGGVAILAGGVAAAIAGEQASTAASTRAKSTTRARARESRAWPRCLHPRLPVIWVGNR